MAHFSTVALVAGPRGRLVTAGRQGKETRGRLAARNNGGGGLGCGGGGGGGGNDNGQNEDANRKFHGR